MIADLEAAVAIAPYEEGLWALLITALYRAGRQADALATYRRVRARLAEDLGLDPGPRLQELERQVLRHDPALRAAPAGNLPSLQAELVGRDEDVAALARLLETERLVEVVGPGGIGKTAVAIATARALPGSVWLARLEAATTADDVLDTVIAALNVTGGEAALLERLRAARTVLVLDNCEHVLDAAAALAVRLLDAAPELRILATSQVALDVDGEVVHELAPLGLDHAVELFTRRAARAGDDPTELCRALDGLPLAIELAAARTRTLSVEEIARRLDDRFSVLSDPTSRKPERRRALRATIGWSYELLFPDDKRGLWALATFAGGASLRAMERVLEALDVPAAAAIDVVGRLAARSLVVVDGDRYRLLDSIRAFALEEMGDARRRGLDAHAAWFAAAAAESTAGVRSARQAEYLELAADRAREHRRRARVEHGARPAAGARDRQRLRLGVDRPRRPPRGAAAARRARGRRRRRRRRRTARRRCCSRRGSRPRPVTSSPPGATSTRPPRSHRAPSSRPAAPTTSPTSSPTAATGSTRSS